MPRGYTTTAKIDDLRKKKMAIQLQKIPSNYDLEAADRPLSKEEEVAEEKAEKFSIKNFRRIKPIPGTLAFLFRNVRGGNETIIEAIKNSFTNSGANSGTSRIRKLVAIWESADEFSKSRIDIFDILCQKLELPRQKVWGAFQEGIFEFNEAITNLAISAHKPALVEKIAQFAGKERNQKDRDLLANISGLKQKETAIQINEGNTTNNNLIVNENSFAQMIKRNNELVRGGPILKQLEEGEGDDFLEGDLVEEEKELVER